MEKARQPARSAGNTRGKYGRPQMAGLIKMMARYAGNCPICKQKIKQGSKIFYDAHEKKAYHVGCVSI